MRFFCFMHFEAFDRVDWIKLSKKVLVVGRQIISGARFADD